MRPFQYARPRSLDELFALLNTRGRSAKLLSGGTDLLVRLRKGHDVPDLVIDLKRVEVLRSDVVSIGPSIRVGARTVLTDVADHVDVRRYFPALVEAALTVGSIQIRNRATLVGNLCNASPAADTAPPLLAYGAVVNVVDAAGTRQVPLDRFFVGPGGTVLRRGELVESIELPVPTEPTGSAFVRLSRRRGADLAIVSVCCVARASGDVRLAFGAAGPCPCVVRDDTGVLLVDGGSSAEGEAALQRMLASACPILDVRASQLYRTAMLRILARRALKTAAARLRSGGQMI